MVQVRFLSKQYGAICSKSVQWILNLRSQNYQNDNHSIASLDWIKEQSKYIDRNGWENWLKTERAYGYNWHLLNQGKKNIPRISKNNSN